jgi:hypothetical protein
VTAALAPRLAAAYTATLWTDRYAQRTRGMAASPIREVLKLVEDPEIISFGGGLPAPEAFPRDEVAAAAQRAPSRPPGLDSWTGTSATSAWSIASAGTLCWPPSPGTFPRECAGPGPTAACSFG